MGSATPQGITIGGFASGIAFGAGVTEYNFHTLNTAVVGTVVASDLITAGSSLTKSGAGMLVLNGSNIAITGTITLNQGLVQISSLNNIGGPSAGGPIVFQGGGLRIGAGFTDDFSSRSLVFRSGGLSTVTGSISVLPQVQISGNTIDTNGVNTVLNSASLALVASARLGLAL